MIRAALFDLDGTIADTAPDLGGAVNRLLVAHGRPPLPLEVLRPVASAGARGLLGVGFGITPEDAGYEELRDAFLAEYRAHICRDTVLFDGIDTVLAHLEANGIAWGIVTNKVESLTHPLIAQLPFSVAPAVVVGGDTTAHPKPHPAPLLHAATKIGVPPDACIYVGDDLRDIQAGQAAGMKTVAAAYGYCGERPPETWGADHLIGKLSDLVELPFMRTARMADLVGSAEA